MSIPDAIHAWIVTNETKQLYFGLLQTLSCLAVVCIMCTVFVYNKLTDFHCLEVLTLGNNGLSDVAAWKTSRKIPIL